MDAAKVAVRFLWWIGENFVALLCFGMALWAITAHEYPTARFFLLMAVLVGIGNTVGDIDRRLRRIETTLAARRGTAETGDDDE